MYFVKRKKKVLNYSSAIKYSLKTFFFVDKSEDEEKKFISKKKPTHTCWISYWLYLKGYT